MDTRDSLTFANCLRRGEVQFGRYRKELGNAGKNLIQSSRAKGLRLRANNGENPLNLSAKESD